MKNLIQYGFLFLILLVSCKNDIEVIRNLTEQKSLPDLSGEVVEIVYTDSSTIKLKLTAPKLIRFENVKEPYYEFPEGLHVYSYDKNKIVISEVQSEWAMYNEAKHLWTVRKNVVAKNNIKNEQLNTEELYWDEEKNILYSDKFVRITNNSGTFYGEKGFEADENMNHWKLIGSKGSINVKDKK